MARVDTEKSGFENPWPWLGFLSLYFLPWLFEAPDAKMLWVTAGALPVFVGAYFWGFNQPPLKRIVGGAIECAIATGVATLMPWSGIALFIFGSIGFAYMRPLSLGLAAIATALIVFLGMAFYQGFPPYYLVWTLASTIAIVGSQIFFSIWGEKNEALLKAKDQLAVQAKDLERARIARDLHDVLGHSLSIISLKSDLVGKFMDQAPEKAKAEVADIHQTARDGLAEIRHVIQNDLSVRFDQELARAQSILHDVGISLHAESQTTVPPSIEMALSLVLREWVTNILKHSGAKNCWVTIKRQRDALYLQLQDDGEGQSGAETIQARTNGLDGIRYRMADMGGSLSIDKTDGFALTIKVPVQEELVA